MKLRSDLVGVVYVDDKAYGAGDDLPDGVIVADSLVDIVPVVAAVEPVKPRRARTSRGA